MNPWTPHAATGRRMATRSIIRVALVGALGAVLALSGCQNQQAKLAEHMARGDAYLKEEKASEAVIEYKNALQLAPNDAKAHYGLAQAYLANKEPQKAFWELQETVRLDGTNIDARLALGQFLLLGREDESLRLLQRAAVLDPGNLFIGRRLLVGYLNIGDDRSVARVLEHLKGTDASVGYRLALARQHFFAGRLSEDRDVLLEVLDDNPESNQALFALAVISRAPDDARFALTRILQRYPEFLDRPQLWDSLASRVCLLAWSGELDRARAVLTQVEADWRRRNAFSITSIVAERGVEVARSLACVGRNDEALAELELLLKEGFDLNGWQHMTYDPAFEALRDHPQFESVLKRLKAAAKLEHERFLSRPELGDADIAALGL